MLSALLASASAFGGVYEEMLNAVDARDIGKVSELLQRGMDVNTSDQAGNSILLLAAQNGDLPILELLIRNKANILTKNKYGDSALMLAALRGHLRSVVSLVAAGAEADPDGWTPLIYASFAGHTEVVRFLLTLDIDVDAQSASGISALMASSRNGHLEIVKILLDQGAEVGLQNQNKLTAMDMARKADNRQIVQQLNRARAR